jgi:Apea-like HEPN
MTSYYEDPTFNNCDAIKYGVVLNDINWENFSEEINLSGWILSKASAEEVAVCKKEISQYSLINYENNPRQEIQFIDCGNGVYDLSQLLDSNLWRYTVIRRTSEAKLKDLQLSEAVLISDINLFIEIWCIENENKKDCSSEMPDNLVGEKPLICLQFSLNPPLPQTLSKSDIEHLQGVVALRAKFDDAKYPVIITAIQMFRELQINPRSSVKILGYFSLIESLLSHAPSPNDSIGSITRQLQRNLTFIHNRLSDGYNLGLNEFGDMTIDKVISRLYSYRSMIAHGGTSTKDLDLLVEAHKKNEGKLWVEIGIQWAERFIRRLIKRVLVYALREPNIVLDLKGISYKK